MVTILDTSVGSHVADEATIAQAQEAILDFAQSDLPGLWIAIDKPTLVAEMQARVMDPFQINQGGQPFCGPTSILFELVRKQPVKYVQICRSLYETGCFKAQTQIVSASERLRQSEGRLRMGQADWLVLSTLRDAENLLFEIDPNASEIMRNLSGITKSWEIKGWVREILGFARVEYTPTYLFGEYDALNTAAQILAAGGVAFALITAEGFLGGNPPLLSVPNHWVTLLGNVALEKGKAFHKDSGRFCCDVYSWGKHFRIEKPQDPFEDYFWGIVTGELYQG